ncbi:hypothetical protein HELRODRAFT_161822 [Helobdella robusta]|uniref:tRNA (32-2'-O)-methyltransferase regulator THADA-like TPR repeats region domain-containing protein n=1 Tax=Helobdella robusta TaxID=6412 RepID=T1ERY2_HELRO|nr:hypothetical protein HELRODRAFT_161822 [Helobdella robusta]ESO02541.1 hypothetical protein HELRODRAFT_161822 [Helobdella robusta]
MVCDEILLCKISDVQKLFSDLRKSPNDSKVVQEQIIKLLDVLLLANREENYKEIRKFILNGLQKLPKTLNTHLYIESYIKKKVFNFLYGSTTDEMTGFENVTKGNKLSSLPATNFIQRFASKFLLDFDWSAASKYQPIRCLVKHVGARTMILIRPNLVECLMLACDDPSLTNHNLLPKLLNRSKPALNMMLEYMIINRHGLSATHNLRAIIACLNLIKNDYYTSSPSSLSTSLSTSSPSALGFNVDDMLELCIMHQDEQIRLDALSIICEHRKTTNPIPPNHLLIVQSYLENNFSSQSPFFRQRMVSILKKVGAFENTSIGLFVSSLIRY